jgi:hypothetical protein
MTAAIPSAWRNDHTAHRLTLALVLDASGIPKRSEVFAGHVSEPKTLEKMSLTSRPNRSADGGA